MRTGLWIATALFALIAVFYAFNSYIQLRERGFTETFDIAIAVASVLLAIAAAWRARTA
jgi:hypothetical protein